MIPFIWIYIGLIAEEVLFSETGLISGTSPDFRDSFPFPGQWSICGLRKLESHEEMLKF
jgi:hypothetical protein